MERRCAVVNSVRASFHFFDAVGQTFLSAKTVAEFARIRPIAASAGVHPAGEKKGASRKKNERFRYR